jgi:hypothetical protein
MDKKFAPKGFKLEPIDVTGTGYATRMDYFTCNFRGCYQPAIDKTAGGFYCEKHLKKEHKNG